MLYAAARSYAEAVRPARDASETKQGFAKLLHQAAAPLVRAAKPRDPEELDALDAVVALELAKAGILPGTNLGLFARKRVKEVAMLPWQIMAFAPEAAAEETGEVTFVGANASSTGTVAFPAGIQSGDYIMVALGSHWSTSSTVTTAPTGFTLLDGPTASDDTSRDTVQRIYTKVAVGTESGNLVMETSALNETATIVVLRGVDTSDPIEDSGVLVGGDANDPRATAPTVAAAGSGRMAVVFLQQSDDIGATNSGWTGGSGTDYTTQAVAGNPAGDDRCAEVATATAAASETISGKRPSSGIVWQQGWVARAYMIKPA